MKVLHTFEFEAFYFSYEYGKLVCLCRASRAVCTCQSANALLEVDHDWPWPDFLPSQHLPGPKQHLGGTASIAVKIRPVVRGGNFERGPKVMCIRMMERRCQQLLPGELDSLRPVQVVAVTHAYASLLIPASTPSPANAARARARRPPTATGATRAPTPTAPPASTAPAIVGRPPTAAGATRAPTSTAPPASTAPASTRATPRTCAAERYWTDAEHQKFLQLHGVYGRQWDKMSSERQSRTETDTRRHALRHLGLCEWQPKRESGFEGRR